MMMPLPTVSASRLHSHSLASARVEGRQSVLPSSSSADTFTQREGSRFPLPSVPNAVKTRGFWSVLAAGSVLGGVATFAVDTAFDRRAERAASTLGAECADKVSKFLGAAPKETTLPPAVVKDQSIKDVIKLIRDSGEPLTNITALEALTCRVGHELNSPNPQISPSDLSAVDRASVVKALAKLNAYATTLNERTPPVFTEAGRPFSLERQPASEATAEFLEAIPSSKKAPVAQ